MTYTQIFSPVIWPMWISSFILLALVIDRLICLRKGRIFDKKMIRDIKKHAQELNLKKAGERAAKSKSLLGKAWSKGFKEYDLGNVSLMESLTESTYIMLNPLKRNITAIGTIASIAPLFGLLGTLIGMIIIFSQLGATSVDEKRQLAMGIGHALYSTIAGLGVAIPGVIFHRYFKSKLIKFAELADFEINQIKHHYIVSGGDKAAIEGRL